MSSTPVIPVLRYRDARTAIGWLERVLGFRATAVHEDESGRVAHAELRLGDSFVMVGTHDPDAPGEFGAIAPAPGGSAIYLVVEDAAAHHANALGNGAEVVMSLRDRDHGSREYAVRDPEGNVWSLGTYAPAG